MRLVHDLKYALRFWCRRPWQAAFVVSALAIGIGASTGVFCVVNALVLRSLPFRDPDRLALLHDFIPPHDSAQQFHAWRQNSTYLMDAALFEDNAANLGANRDASRAHVVQTTWNFFSLLGVRPVLGRGLAPGDDINGTGWGLPGPNSEAVIGYGLWQQFFGGEPNVLGSTIQIRWETAHDRGRRPPGIRLSGAGRSLETSSVQPWKQWLGNRCPAQAERFVASGARSVYRRGDAPLTNRKI